MISPFAVMRALMVKDLRLLWPLVLLNFVLVLVRDLIPPAIEPQHLIGTLSTCAAALLIVALVHVDAPASLRLDWLTRPVPPAALLAEKLIFLFSALLLPPFCCQLLYGLWAGLPPVEALRLASSAHVATLPLSLGLMAVAALTRTLIEASAVALAVAFIGTLVASLFELLVGFPIDHLPVGSLSSLTWCLNAVGLAASALVLLLQYVLRRTTASWAVFVGALALLAAIQAMFVLSLSTAQG